VVLPRTSHNIRQLRALRIEIVLYQSNSAEIVTLQAWFMCSITDPCNAGILRVCFLPSRSTFCLKSIKFVTLPHPFFLLILWELPVCAMHMRGAITSRDGGYSCSSLRSYYISMNWLKPESSRGGPFQLTPTHYLSRYSRCLERTPSGPRLPKWPALHYEKSRSTDVSVSMEIIDWVSWKETFCWMFVGHSPCVHMISSKLRCIIHTWANVAMY